MAAAGCQRYWLGTWQTVRSAFTFDPIAEKFAFARFQPDEAPDAEPVAPGGRKSVDTELADFRSNGAPVPARRKLGSISDEPAPEKVKDRNKISAWQAGWNVTNAIQVYITRQPCLIARTMVDLTPD